MFKGTPVIKTSFKIAVLLAAFFSFSSFGTGEIGVDWMPPDIKYQYRIYVYVNEYAETKELAAQKWFDITGNYDCGNWVFAYENETTTLWTYQFTVQEGGGCGGGSQYIYREQIGVACEELDWPNGEDIDNPLDGEVDHCHKSECDRNGEMFLNPGLAGPYLCIAQGNGEYCEHQVANVENPDGSVGVSIIRPTGESCGNDSEGFEQDPWVPLEDDGLPDPNDPNEPPSDDGDPDCTPIDGTGLNVCNADESEVCPDGICPPGCGTVNGNFVCITEDGGGEANVDPVEDENDNSDNQAPDDPNTAGDEATHSRLDGLLQNTDGLEGLLQGIKDAIGDIPGGGGGDSSEDPGEEDEPHCTGGQFYIGEACISFDKNDKPVNGDLDFTEVNQKIDGARQDLQAQFNTIKADLDGMFNFGFTGGSYTVNTATVYGNTIDFGLARLSSLFDFSMWGLVVMFLFAIKAVFILVGSR